jgi:hypothetical protein
MASIDEHPYCTATVIRDDEVDPPNETIAIQVSFDEVRAYLIEVYDWFIDELSERRGEDPAWEAERRRLGGFGVQLRNRWGSEVEVGVGRKVWFLHRHEPKPSRTLSDNPEVNGYLVFYLDGWHWTELDRTQLASREACLSTLRDWLEENRFPDRRDSMIGNRQA